MTVASIMNSRSRQSRSACRAMPLDEIDVSDPALYQHDVWQPYFGRLRREDPVHWCRTSEFGPYWSVTKYKDIIAVESNHRRFSSSRRSAASPSATGPADLGCRCSSPWTRPSTTSSARRSAHRRAGQPGGAGA